MKNFKKLLVCMLAILACCGLLAGCGSSNSDKVGTLTLGFNKDPVGDLNPHAYLPNQFITIDMVYEGLVQYGEGGKIKPQLAESWEVSKDGLTYTFHLRKNVKFSDGSDFTAENVVKNFKTIFSDKNKASHSWFGLTDEIASYDAPDKYTFVLHLKHPYTPTLFDLAMIRPIRFVGDAAFPANGDTATGLKAPIGTGPWMLKDHKPGEYATFVPNPYYWGEKPAAKEITIKVVPDPETMALQFESGDLDMIYGNSLISLDRFNSYRKDSKYVTEVSEPMSTRLLMMNTNNAILRNHEVRVALEHAVDKAAISEHIFGGVEKPANTMFAPSVPHTDKVKLQPYNFSMEEAGKMLDQAGWKMGSNGYREKDGKVFELFFPYRSSELADKSIAEYIQSEWKKLGIKVTLKALESKQYWEEARKGNFDIMFDFTWGAPWDPHAYLNAMTISSEGGGPVFTAEQGLPNKAQLDKQIHQLFVEPNPQKLETEYANVLTELHNDAVFIPITYQALEVVYRKGELAGVSFMPEENRLPVFTATRVK